jgi:hypothetical protein
MNCMSNTQVLVALRLNAYEIRGINHTGFGPLGSNPKSAGFALFAILIFLPCGHEEHK